MIPQSFVQELLGRVDIVEVVDRHVKLKRAGANYVACCPFHSEKTPSFTVSQTKQFYHCFGCGAHGTAVGFLIEYSGLGFVDAVKELAQSAGMKVPEIRSETGERRAKEGDDLYSVLLKAAQYYRSQLKASPEAIAYLKRRGLSGEIAKQFGIGYAPGGWQNLAAAFSDYDGKALSAAGLTKVSEKATEDTQREGRRYDVFRDRIMFPIVDVRGNVIGFGGRVTGDGEPKYLNTPETPVFEKGRELYGLYQARRAIRDAGRVVVVEGYMDVVALAQAGVDYAVATLGTATTPLHVQKLMRQGDEIVFCFDGDNAGRRAAWRALENALPQLQDGKQVKFLFLPEGEDPDTYVRKHGKSMFEAQLADAMTLSSFMRTELCARVDLATMEGRAALLESARPLVTQVNAPFLKSAMVQEFSKLGDIDPRLLAERYGLERRTTQTRAAPPTVPRNQTVTNEKAILTGLIAKPELLGALDVELETRPSDQTLSLLHEVIDFLKQSPTPPSSAALIQHFSGGTYDALIASVTRKIAGDWSENFDIDAEFKGAVEKIKRFQRDRTMTPLVQKDRNKKWTSDEAETYTKWQLAKGGDIPRTDKDSGPH
jgi:DNA primase